LLSVQSRFAKFRPSKIPDTNPVSDISLDALLAEVARRQRVLGQLSVVLSADTALARNPHIRPDTIRVSAVQWALLIRVRHGSTPRDLAWDLSRSVFGTMIEAYRLLARQLLSVVGPRPDGPEPGLAAMSFVRAVSVEKGETVPTINVSAAPGGAD
jgi:hypothetical protein